MAEAANATLVWRAEPLIWGRGPRTFEAFLEPTCPYSAKAFPKLAELLAAAGEDRLTVKIRLLSQPWHLFSGSSAGRSSPPPPPRAAARRRGG